MQLLVVSDSHRDFFTLNEIVKKHSNIDAILHLGDGSEEIQKIKELYPQYMVTAVKGNCDLCSNLPDERELNIDGYKIFMTHGNLYNVKLGLSSICAKAQSLKANILLFGHTHIPFSDYQFGLYILNPGSIRGINGTYAILDVSPSGVVTNILDVDFINQPRPSLFKRTPKNENFKKY